MSGSISIRIENLKEGDGEAAHFMWDRFFPQLKRIARVKLANTADPLLDEEDIAAGAFASFCRGIESGRFDRLENRDDIWQILMMLTARKAIDHLRYTSREKRRLLYGRDGEKASFTASREEIEQLADQQPSAELALLFAEEFGVLLDRLKQPILKQIALDKLEGYTDFEISQRLGVARRTVVRKLRVIRGIWESALN